MSFYTLYVHVLGLSRSSSPSCASAWRGANARGLAIASNRTEPADRAAAKLSHVALYGFMTVMPATGIAMGYFGGKGLPFFFTTIPGAQGEAKRGAWAGQAFKIHKTVGTYWKYLPLVHIGAVGVHFAKGQNILKRMI